MNKLVSGQVSGQVASRVVNSEAASSDVGAKVWLYISAYLAANGEYSMTARLGGISGQVVAKRQGLAVLAAFGESASTELCRLGRERDQWFGANRGGTWDMLVREAQADVARAIAANTCKVQVGSVLELSSEWNFPSASRLSSCSLL